MLSFGCGNHGDIHPVCVCSCLHEKIGWVAFLKSSHTHPGKHKAQRKRVCAAHFTRPLTNTDFTQRTCFRDVRLTIYIHKNLYYTQRQERENANKYNRASLRLQQKEAPALKTRVCVGVSRWVGGRAVCYGCDVTTTVFHPLNLFLCYIIHHPNTPFK